MALNRNDYTVLLRLLQGRLREYDPESFEAVGSSFERGTNPRAALLDYISLTIKVAAERSGGENGRILNLLNRYVRTEKGGPVQALRIELSPAERELYEAESFDLARLPDRSEFIEYLQGLRGEILEDHGYRGEDEL